MERLNSLQLKFEARQKLQGLKNDMLVLKNIWFKKLQVRDCAGTAGRQRLAVVQFAACGAAGASSGCRAGPAAGHAPLKACPRGVWRPRSCADPLWLCAPLPQDTDDHAERLEGFYSGQAHACEAKP